MLSKWPRSIMHVAQTDHVRSHRTVPDSEASTESDSDELPDLGFGAEM